MHHETFNLRFAKNKKEREWIIVLKLLDTYKDMEMLSLFFP